MPIPCHLDWGGCPPPTPPTSPIPVTGKCRGCPSGDTGYYDDVSDLAKSNPEEAAGSYDTVPAPYPATDSNSNEDVMLTKNNIILLSCLISFVLLVIAVSVYFIYRRHSIKSQKDNIKKVENQTSPNLERVDSNEVVETVELADAEKEENL